MDKQSEVQRATPRSQRVGEGVGRRAQKRDKVPFNQLTVSCVEFEPESFPSLSVTG
jgi:hypothetical protein